jgi:hypothetical protein
MHAAFQHPTGETPQQKRQPLTLGRSIWKGDHDHALILHRLTAQSNIAQLGAFAAYDVKSAGQMLR